MKILLEDLPLRPTVGAALIVGLLLPAVLVGWRVVTEQRETLFDHMADDHARIVEMLAIGMQTPIWDVRPETGQPLIAAIMRDPRVTAVNVMAPVMPAFLEAKNAERDVESIVELERPVFYQGREIGAVRVEMTTALLEARAVRQGWQAIMMAFLQMAVGLLLIFPLIRLKVLAPLGYLVERSRELASGNLDQPLNWRRRDELGSLGRSFENTRLSLQSLFGDLEQRNAQLEAREAELSRQTRVLRATLENMTDGISVVDGDLRLVAWNDRIVELFEFPPGLVREGTPMADLHRFDVERGYLTAVEAKALADAMQAGTGPRQPFTTQTETANGKAILLRRCPLPEGGYVTTYTDITEQVRARRAVDDTLQLLAAVMDAVPAILHVKDRALRYQFVNRYFLDLFGLRREQVLGRTLTEALRPEWLTEFTDLGPQVLASGEAIANYEMAVRRRDGRRLHMLGSKVPLLDAGGQVTHVVTFEIDITERKRIQQALSDSEELYRLLVNQSPYGVLLHDPDAVVFINPAGCRILGASDPKQVVGRHYREFVAKSDRESGMSRLQRILDPGESVAQIERHLVALDGREITVAASGVPFTRGEKRLALIIFVDISEMKRAQAEIVRQREALHQAEKMSALGSLLAGVAHELNNPLSIVVGRAIILEESELDPTVAAGVAKIRAAAERCARIVKTFLAMARQQAPARVPVRVEAIIQASLDLLAYGLESAGIRVHLQLASDLPETMADPDQLGQVFNNLVTNARQALVGWSGPRELWITSRLERDPDRIRLTVADSGPGVPDEARGRIFDPFFTTKPMEAGTGIGLALCRGVVEAHGGTIDLGDSEHGGATFVLSLPVVAAPTVSKSVETVGVDEPSGGRRVLIVDDEEEIRDMLADILLADGHQVEKVVNGREALDLLTERSFDLIISDLIMPVLDGPGLYDALRRQDPDMANRLVFITGDTLGPTARRFLRQAGRPVIEKPFVPEEMRRAVAANVV